MHLVDKVAAGIYNDVIQKEVLIMTMGEKILIMRKARGWSQEELAEHIGVTRQAVSRWESDSAKPDADNIIMVCDLFGVTADYLLRDLGGGAANVPLKQETELEKAIRTMPLRRWVGGILILVCGAALIVFQVLSVMHPAAYDHLRGLEAFLKLYGMEPVWHTAAAGLIIGLWKAFSPKPLKEYPVREWIGKILRWVKTGVLGFCKTIWKWNSR